MIKGRNRNNYFGAGHGFPTHEPQNIEIGSNFITDYETNPIITIKSSSRNHVPSEFISRRGSLPNEFLTQTNILPNQYRTSIQTPTQPMPTFQTVRQPTMQTVRQQTLIKTQKEFAKSSIKYLTKQRTKTTDLEVRPSKIFNRDVGREPATLSNQLPSFEGANQSAKSCLDKYSVGWASIPENESKHPSTIQISPLYAGKMPPPLINFIKLNKVQIKHTHNGLGKTIRDDLVLTGGSSKFLKTRRQALIINRPVSTIQNTHLYAQFDKSPIQDPFSQTQEILDCDTTVCAGYDEPGVGLEELKTISMDLKMKGVDYMYC